MTFQSEHWKDFYREALPIFRRHWNDLGLDRELIQMDPDHERYINLDNMGMLLVVTAREGGTLVGYSIWFLMQHFHYKSSGLMGITDMYYLLPEYRKGFGARLFAAAELEMRKRGVVRAHTSCKVHEDHQRLFELMGWKFTDKTFSKVLKCQ